MAIQKTDVKLLKSQRLTDEDDGGGRATGVAVVDGEVNNLFPDISRLDRTTGRINLRKGFAGVLTDNADAYLGAHAIVTESPADPRVSVLLFNTGSQTDERVDARSQIESYVTPATAAQLELLGNQLRGQRAISAVQREENREPEIGEVYQLVNGTISNQYVRITSVESASENFIYEYAGGQYLTLPRRRLTLGISAPLLASYPGGSVIPAGTSATNIAGQAKSSVLATQVADAARYYGISPLADAVMQGDMTCKVQSVYSQLVPSAVKESPMIDLLGGYTRPQMIAAGPARTVALTFAQVVAGHSRTFIGTGALPGSISLTIQGVVYTDDKAGKLTAAAGTFSELAIDYRTGEINGYRSSTYTGIASATYTPAAGVTGETVTGLQGITLATRGYVYTLALAEAKPRPGTLSVSYMALGKWYELLDNGAGELVGEGSGTIDFATGSVSISLSSLPDVDSALLYSYITQADDQVTQHTGAAIVPAIRVQQQLPHTGIKPGSVVITYMAGGVTRTLTDSAGSLSGDGSGVIVYATGWMDLQLSLTPDYGTTIGYSYEQALTVTASISASADQFGTVSGSVADAPLMPGTVSASWMVSRAAQLPAASIVGTSYESTYLVTRRVHDDGQGGWLDDRDQPVEGTINYTTGAFTLHVAKLYGVTEYDYADSTCSSTAIGSAAGEGGKLVYGDNNPLAMAKLTSYQDFQAAKIANQPTCSGFSCGVPAG